MARTFLEAGTKLALGKRRITGPRNRVTSLKFRFQHRKKPLQQRFHPRSAGQLVEQHVATHSLVNGTSDIIIPFLCDAVDLPAITAHGPDGALPRTIVRNQNLRQHRKGANGDGQTRQDGIKNPCAKDL